MLLGRAPTRLDQSLRPRDPRVGRRRREQGLGAAEAEPPRQFVQHRLRRVARLDAARQIVGGLAHRAEPLAQGVDGVPLREQRRIDFERADLRFVGRLLRGEAIEFGAQLGVVAERRAPLGERARGRWGEIGEGLDLLRQRRQPRELGVGSLRALASREREAGLLMLRRQGVFACASAHRSVVGARERVGGDDRLAQAPLGVVVPLQRDIKRLAGGFARREQRVGFRGEFFTKRGQRAEAGGARGQGFRQPAALSEEVPTALAQRLGGEAELGAELRAIDRSQPALQMIVGQGPVVFVDERVLGALAALQALQRAVRHAQRAADPQQPHIVREIIGRLRGEAEQQVADRRERRRLARFVGAEHHVQRRAGTKAQGPIGEPSIGRESQPLDPHEDASALK